MCNYFSHKMEMGLSPLTSLFCNIKGNILIHKSCYCPEYSSWKLYPYIHYPYFHCVKLAFNPPRQYLIKQKDCLLGKAQTCRRVMESITGDINKLRKQKKISLAILK